MTRLPLLWNGEATDAMQRQSNVSIGTEMPGSCMALIRIAAQWKGKALLRIGKETLGIAPYCNGKAPKCVALRRNGIDWYATYCEGLALIGAETQHKAKE